MKVKKIILTMVSALIIVAIAMQSIVLATTPLPDVPVLLKNLNYNNDEVTEYSIGTNNGVDTNVIKMHKLADVTNGGKSVINDAYCAWADIGFEASEDGYLKRTLQEGENAYIDTYTKKLDMVEKREEILQTTSPYLYNPEDQIEGVSKYDAILQLTNLFLIDEDDYVTYLDTILKAAIEDGSRTTLPYEIEYGDSIKKLYNDGVENAVLNEEQIRAVQQAALWYFTSFGDSSHSLYNKRGEHGGWLEVRNSAGSSKPIYDLTVEIGDVEHHLLDDESQALYDYLIKTAIANAKAENPTVKNTVYLYSTENPIERATTQTIIMITRENKEFDLALRKYISSVTTNEITTTYNEAGERMPNVDPEPLEEETDTTAIYKHRKDPVVVEKGSKVNYRLVIYNEGDIDGRATKVIDKLPAGVKFLSVVSGNFESDGTYTTTNNTLTLVRKSDNTTDLPAYTSGIPANEVIEIQCEVTADPDPRNDKVFTNIAWIAEHASNKGTYTDRDSNNPSAPNGGSTTPTLPTNLVTTKPDVGYTNGDNHDLTDKDHYFEGQEDDDDFEKIILKSKKFDLALRKFIYSINGEEKGRTPVAKDETITEDTTGRKDHPKNVLQVSKGDTVIYTIRIYNEGEIAGTATEVADYLPAGLEFVTPGTGEGQSSINLENGWSEPDSTGKITTAKLAGEVIQPLNNADWSELDALDNNGKPIYYRDLQVECKVKETATSKTLKNVAEITEDTGDDIDSHPGEETPSPEDYGTPETSPKGRGYEDDDDYEDLKLVELDLALRKFITRVADNAEMTGATEYDRAPNYTFDTPEKFINGEITTATYNHTKQPVKVNAGDYVEYILRIYNEGSMDGYAREITDHLPEYLEYVDCEANNTKYKWNVSEDGRTVTTNYLKDTKLNAVSFETWDGGGYPTGRYYNGEVIVLDSTEKLQSNELKIICKVKDTVPCEKNQTNIAEISLYGFTTDNGNTIVEKTVDRDSQTTDGGEVKLPSDTDLPNYRKSEIDAKIPYIPGQQDDDDFEKVYVPKFDLALRKFITKVEKVEGETRTDRYSKEDYDARVPQISQESYEKLVNGETTTLDYSHSKEPMNTVKTDEVTYTLRIYNEGNMDGYASVITDDIPDGVVFLPDNATNKAYGWKMFTELPEGATAEDGKEMVELNINGSSEVKKYIETDDASKAVIIRTDYLSYEKGEERRINENLSVNPNKIKALDLQAGLSDTNPDYRDLKVVFKVTEEYGSDRILINYAQISDDQDDEGKPVKDIDSTPDRWNEGEDDQDIEKIRVPQFDLALRKWVTQAIVTENGKTTVTQTGHQPFDDPEEIVKVELHRKKLSNVTVKFRYSIRVYNDGYDKETGEALPGHIAGYAKEVKDHIPEGLKFVAEDNPDWTDLGNNVITTRKLENTLLQPGEYADVEVVLTWINGNDNLGLKVNYAEISEDYNDWGVPDKDSTPDNMKERHEDDDDEAPVMLSVSTGAVVTYIGLGLVVLVTIAGGIILIKKYVM